LWQKLISFTILTAEWSPLIFILVSISLNLQYSLTVNVKLFWNIAWLKFQKFLIGNILHEEVAKQKFSCRAGQIIMKESPCQMKKGI